MSHEPRFPAERFEKYVERVPFLTCWVWVGCSTKNGYGDFHWSGRSTHLQAHQASFRIYKGSYSGVIRHTCDNPWCVNPDHLLEGTQADNIRDMVERGRASTVARKLTMQQVEELRSSTDWGKTLARKFGVAESTICKIRKGYRYVRS